MKQALLYLHTAVLLWGFTGVLGRAIALDAPVLVWYRMLLTAVLVLVIVLVRREWRSIPPKDLAMLTLVGALMGIHWVAFYGAIKFANSSIALICLSTASIFTSIIDPFVNKSKHNIGELLIGGVALAGVYLIYQSEEFFGKGIFFGVMAALLSSVFTVFNKKIASRYPARLMVFWEMGTGWIVLTILLGILVLAGGTHLLVAGPQQQGLHWMPGGWDLLWLLILSLCCTVWAQSLALSALKQLSAFTVTLSVNLEPVYGVILAFLIFHENKELNNGFYIGMALIMISVFLQMFLLLRSRNSPGLIREKGGID